MHLSPADYLQSGQDPSMVMIDGYTEDTVVEQQELSERATALSECLSNLPERSRFIIESHHGLFGTAQLTLKEIARLIGMSPESVRQLEQAALRDLGGLLKGRLE